MNDFFLLRDNTITYEVFAGCSCELGFQGSPRYPWFLVKEPFTRFFFHHWGKLVLMMEISLVNFVKKAQGSQYLCFKNSEKETNQPSVCRLVQ